jgi:3-oxoacyl-[acyl-carrier protein] reductase
LKNEKNNIGGKALIDIKGRWALVTGASRGIGYELVHFLADQGCNLIIHSRKLESTETVEEELLKKDVKVLRVAAEFTDMKQVDKMLETIDGFDVTVDLVFNNAGYQIAYRTDYFNTPMEDYEISFKINTMAPAKICYHFIPKMIEEGFGRVINTTSDIALEPEQAGYSARKAALNKITIDLSSKLDATNVLLNLTNPGWSRTDLGGPSAPYDVKDSLPGVALGAFIDDEINGYLFDAPNYHGLSLEEALEKVKENRG